MPTKFISSRTAPLYENANADARSMVLIYGDEVTTTGNATNNRTPVSFRGRPGFITTNSLSDNAALELYFIDVGQGDSTFLVTPGRKKILVDGGVNRRALGFLAWKYQLDQPGASVDIDLLVLSHADGDHIEGLIPIIQHPKIHVKKVIHSGIATFKAGQFDTALGQKVGDHIVTRHAQLNDFTDQQLSATFASWRNAIAAENNPQIAYEAVDLNTGFINAGDPSITLEVIGPRLETVGGQPAYRWFDDHAHTINGHSVVLRLTHQNVQVLLSGDLNTSGERHLLAGVGVQQKLSAHVLKAPHHGSHEFEPDFFAAVRPQISVVSSGNSPDHGHPRAVFLGQIGKWSRSDLPLLFSTEIAASFVEVDVPAPAGGGNPADPDANLRNLFKRRLHGMINVRSEGTRLYAARRVAAGYWWEAYGPITPAP
jgi:beta-lactamase superfamily II metal-dependent hydrolase